MSPHKKNGLGDIIYPVYKQRWICKYKFYILRINILNLFAQSGRLFTPDTMITNQFSQTSLCGCYITWMLYKMDVLCMRCLIYTNILQQVSWELNKQIGQADHAERDNIYWTEQAWRKYCGCSILYWIFESSNWIPQDLDSRTKEKA